MAFFRIVITGVLHCSCENIDWDGMIAHVISSQNYFIMNAVKLFFFMEKKCEKKSSMASSKQYMHFVSEETTVNQQYSQETACCR